MKRRKGRAQSVYIVARFMADVPSRGVSAEDVEAATGLSRVHVNAAIGSLNSKREIHRVGSDHWLPTARLARVLRCVPLSLEVASTPTTRGEAWRDCRDWTTDHEYRMVCEAMAKQVKAERDGLEPSQPR